MTKFNALLGSDIQLFTSSTVIIIAVLMVMMAAKLLKSNRKKQIYILLIFALITTITRQFIIIFNTVLIEQHSSILYIISTSMGLISFILFNFVFMKLYTPQSAALRNSTFIILTGLSIVFTVIQAYISPYLIEANESVYVTFPLLDLYTFLIIALMLIETRHVEMSKKYYASLIVFFTSELLRLADVYIFHNDQVWLTVISIVLPTIYFILLFMLLFEWVIERLLSTYQSSISDGLTGLFNRKSFNTRANGMMKKKNIAIIFCDIDNFKKLNDTQGHLNADIALKKVAQIIKEETSSYGIAGRYGGEELLGAVYIDKKKPEKIAEAIRSRVEQETVVTISVGISSMSDGMDLQQLTKQADDAMYYSKTTGKNKVSHYRSLPASLKNKS